MTSTPSVHAAVPGQPSGPRMFFSYLVLNGVIVAAGIGLVLLGHKAPLPPSRRPRHRRRRLSPSPVRPQRRKGRAISDRPCPLPHFRNRPAHGSPRKASPMNTNLTNTPLTTRTIALTACLIALYAGATACGTDGGTATAPAAISKQGTSEGFIKSSRADQAEYLRQLQRQAGGRDPAEAVRGRPTPAERAAHVRRRPTPAERVGPDRSRSSPPVPGASTAGPRGSRGPAVVR